ncbi:MAG: hypothetical protein AB7S26_02110 [Sandaracinaceae bacterium]
MAEESAHGKLSPTDRFWDQKKFMVLFVVTLGAALALIYFIAGYKSGDFTWNPLSHDIVRHTIETSTF